MSYKATPNSRMKTHVRACARTHTDLAFWYWLIKAMPYKL